MNWIALVTQTTNNCEALMFDVFTKNTPLPVVNRDVETQRLDFKQRPSKRGFENAKDVAALANAVGGTLLVGAKDDPPTGLLLSYTPMTLPEAAQAQADYDRAVRDRCYPRPLYGFEKIPFKQRVLLAVNVWPYPGQVIGVKVAGDKANEGYGGPAYVFPLRVGQNTTDLQPDQTAMLMIPTVRRIAIMLSKIPKDEKITVQYKRPIRDSIQTEPLWFIDYEILENRLKLENRMASPTEHLFVPLDAVDSVWEDDDGWTIAVDGGFHVADQGRRRWVFHQKA